MKKVIRLTESDLMNIVKRIINEEMISEGLTKEELKSLSDFFNIVNQNSNYLNSDAVWVQDEKNKSNYSTTVRLTKPMSYSNRFDFKKPLIWSLSKNNKINPNDYFKFIKVPGASNKQYGSLFYEYSVPSKFSNFVSKPLIGNVETAANDFIKFQK